MLTDVCRTAPLLLLAALESLPWPCKACHNVHERSQWVHTCHSWQNNSTVKWAVSSHISLLDCVLNHHTQSPFTDLRQRGVAGQQQIFGIKQKPQNICATEEGARTLDHKVKSLALYQLSYSGPCLRISGLGCPRMIWASGDIADNK